MILSLMIMFGYTLSASAAVVFGTPAPGFSNRIRVERLIKAGRFEEAERVRKESPNYRVSDDEDILIAKLQAQIEGLKRQIEELMK